MPKVRRAELEPEPGEGRKGSKKVLRLMVDAESRDLSGFLGREPLRPPTARTGGVRAGRSRNQSKANLVPGPRSEAQEAQEAG